MRAGHCHKGPGDLFLHCTMNSLMQAGRIKAASIFHAPSQHRLCLLVVLVQSRLWLPLHGALTVKLQGLVGYGAGNAVHARVKLGMARSPYLSWYCHALYRFCQTEFFFEWPILACA